MSTKRINLFREHNYNEHISVSIIINNNGTINNILAFQMYTIELNY